MNEVELIESEPTPSPLNTNLFMLSQRDRVILAFEAVGFTFSMGVPTPDKLMQYIGTTRDRLTTIQLLGPADKLKRVGMLIGYPRGAPGLGTFQGKSMVVLVGLLIPGWTEGPRILAQQVNALLKKSPQHFIGPQGEKLHLELVKKHAYLALRVEWP